MKKARLKFEPFQTLEVVDLPKFLSGTLAGAPSWTVSDWVVHGEGFRLNTGVDVENGVKKQMNPRKTGKWEFIIREPFMKKWVAYEYLRCSGKMDCTLNENGFCSVILKITYTIPSQCVISVSSFNHGINFKPDISKLKLSEKSKTEILLLSKVISPLRLKPIQIYSSLCKNATQNNLPLQNTAILPTLRQVNDLLYYDRKKQKTGNFYMDLDEFITQHKHAVIFPSEDTNYPSQRVGDTVIVLKSRQQAFSQFVSGIKDGAIVGMDAQFANNTARLPLYVVVIQNMTFETVPGFIFLLEKNTTNNLSTALRCCINYLRDHYSYEWKSKFCIDKDNVEQSALSGLGFSYLLCEFHVFRTISRSLASNKDKGEIMKLIKEIARSKDQESLQSSIMTLKQFCSGYHSKFFDKFEKNWLCNRWLTSWTDISRDSRWTK
jgi:hypothetical protein